MWIPGYTCVRVRGLRVVIMTLRHPQTGTVSGLFPRGGWGRSCHLQRSWTQTRRAAGPVVAIRPRIKRGPEQCHGASVLQVAQALSLLASGWLGRPCLLTTARDTEKLAVPWGRHFQHCHSSPEMARRCHLRALRGGPQVGHSPTRDRPVHPVETPFGVPVPVFGVASGWCCFAPRGDTLVAARCLAVSWGCGGVRSTFKGH